MPLIARRDKNFKKRFGYFILSDTITIMVYLLVYLILGVAFTKMPSDYQWILGFVSHFICEIFIWFLFKLVSKAADAGSDMHKVQLMCSHYVECVHAIYMAIILASVATKATTYTIIGIDFITNIYNGLTIVYAFKYSKKKNSRNEGRS